MKRRRIAKDRVFGNQEAETKTKKNHNRHIPQCLLVEEIFTRLPIKSLLRFKCLSKQWYSVISSTRFAQLHLHHQSPIKLSQPNCSNYLLFDSGGFLHTLKWASYSSHNEGLTRFTGPIYTNFNAAFTWFVGSCNGLICSLQNSHYYFLWNPSTRKYRKIVHPFNKPEDFNTCFGFLGGFGYVPSIDDYKIVQIMVFEFPRPIEISIFTLSVGAWKHLRIIDEEIYYLVGCMMLHCVVKPGMTLVNETLHWLVCISDCTSEKALRLLAFDLVKEVILEIRPPNTWLEEGFVSVVQGCLGLCSFCWKRGLVEIWAMEEYGVEGSWRKLFKLELKMGLVGSKLPHWNLFGGFARILIRSSDGKHHMFVDLSRDPPAKVSLPQDLYLSFGISYVETLVSPFFAQEDNSSLGSLFGVSSIWAAIVPKKASTLLIKL